MKKKLFFLFGIVLLITCCSYSPSLIYNRVYQYGDYKFKQLYTHSVSFCGFASDEAARTAQAFSREFVIPETIYGQPVTQIESEAFMSSTLFDRIIVPKTVTVIGRAAFYKCTATISTSGNIVSNQGLLPPAGGNENPYENNNNNNNNNSGNGNNNGNSGNNNGSSGNSGNNSSNNNNGGYNNGGNGNNNSESNNNGGNSSGGNNYNPSSPVEQYMGSYSGTYTIAGFNGNWTGRVERDGIMSFSFDGKQATTGLSPSGHFSATSDGLFIEGTISSSGRVNGTLKAMTGEHNESGSFEGNRL